MRPGPIKRYRIKRRLRRIARLEAEAIRLRDAMPTRQLRRQADRRARKILGGKGR